jgi:vancomycin resistance protein VanJ
LSLLVLLPLALLQQKHALLLGLSVPCIVFLILYGARFLPKAEAAEIGNAPALTVMSFNMHYENWNHDAFVQSIRDAKPDIVGIQEVSPTNREMIEARLGEKYPYRVFQPVQEMHAVALLSRFPISRVEYLEPAMKRGLRATVQLSDKTLDVVVAHLAPPNMITYPITRFVPIAQQRYTSRRAEAALLDEIGRSHSRPSILLCDCNMSDASATYQSIASAWRDSFVERGWGLGPTLRFIAPFPIQRYDYVWHTDEIHIHSVRVGTDGGSDHLPVIAKISFSELLQSF